MDFTDIVENIEVPIISFDQDWRFTYVNDAAERSWNCIFPYSSDNIIGKILWQEFPDLIGTEIDDKYHEAIQEQKKISFEIFLPKTKKWLKYHLSPIKNGLAVCWQDITTEKMLQEKYIDENAKLQQLIDLSPLGIVFIDDAEIVTVISDSYQKLYLAGKDKSQFIGKPAKLLIEAVGIEWESSTIYKALKGISTFKQYVKQAAQRSTLINAAPLKNSEKKIKGAMLVVNDITDFESLRNEISKLDRLNLIGEMAAGVAHEIRNPMTVVKGYLQMFRKKEQGAATTTEKIEQYDIILAELSRVEKIIKDFLSLARRKESNLVPADLNTIINELSPLIFSDAIKNNVNYILELQDDLPQLLLDSQEIKQLILNLSRNGIEAVQERGTLAISTAQRDNNVILSIGDTGCGMSQEVLEKVFNPFFTTKENGTGLGLAVCNSIVEHHKGKIDVQSECGKGTTFEIIFSVKA